MGESPWMKTVGLPQAHKATGLAATLPLFLSLYTKLLSRSKSLLLVWGMIHPSAVPSQLPPNRKTGTKGYSVGLVEHSQLPVYQKLSWPGDALTKLSALMQLQCHWYRKSDQLWEAGEN